VSPSNASLLTQGTQLFAAEVQGTGAFSTQVTWLVNDVSGGNATLEQFPSEDSTPRRPCHPLRIRFRSRLSAHRTQLNSAAPAPSVSNPVPALSVIAPASIDQGVGPLTFTISGSGFDRSSYVTISGSSRSCTFVDADHLQIILSTADGCVDRSIAWVNFWVCDGSTLISRSTLCRLERLWEGQLLDPETEASIRFIPFGPALLATLNGQKQVLAASELQTTSYFRSLPHNPDVLRRDILYPALDCLGIARSPRSSGFHRFRHSAATIVNQQTENLKLVQRLLGHSNLGTTGDVYTHTFAEAEREATNALEPAIYGDLFSNVLETENNEGYVAPN
jgi:hypothetical protein